MVHSASGEALERAEDGMAVALMAGRHGGENYRGTQLARNRCFRAGGDFIDGAQTWVHEPSRAEPRAQAISKKRSISLVASSHPSAARRRR
jgi:hypothetical protein